MQRIVICDDVEIERTLMKEILTEYFDEIHREVSIIEYDSGATPARAPDTVESIAYAKYLKAITPSE